MTKSKQRTATGAVETTLPFHPHLDAARFEQFCTDLLNLHPVVFCERGGRPVQRRILGATRLASGQPQKGADIRADAEAGEVWIVQCKNVSSFSQAQVEAAFQEAEHGHPRADQYLLITACGLGGKAQEPIHPRPTKWMWWDAGRLTIEVQQLRPIEDAMSLVNRYFDKEQLKRLFPWGDQPLLKPDEFFASDLAPERRLFHHRTPFVVRGVDLDRLLAFARSGAGRAMVLSAAGGQGKSRLLLELARELEQPKPPHALRVRFLNLSQRGLTEGGADLLARQENLLLVVEDAHRLDSVLGDVAKALAAKSASNRLLVATRPHAAMVVQSQLFNNGYAEKLEPTSELRRWKRQDLTELAERLLTHSDSVRAARLARLADGCPLLLVIAAELINNGETLTGLKDEQVFRERVFNRFKDEFLRQLPELIRGRAARLIQLLAFLSPVPKNEVLIEKAARFLGERPLDVEEALGQLQGAGLVVENSQGLRLYPDLFADAVLLDACLEPAGRPSYLHQRVLAEFSATGFPALLRNVAQADWEARTRKGARASLFDPLWQDFVRRFEALPWPEPSSETEDDFLHLSGTRPLDRESLLHEWAPVAVYLAERTLELAELAIRCAEAPPPGSEPTAAKSNEAWSLLGRTLPTLLKPIMLGQSPHASDALDLLWSLATHEPAGGSRGAGGPVAAIADAVEAGLREGTQAPRTILRWLERRFVETSTHEELRRRPWAVGALLRPFFNRRIKHEWVDAKALHVLHVAVDVPRTRPLREGALGIARRLIASGDAKLAAAAVPVIRQALQPLGPHLGVQPAARDHEAWRPERLDALKVLDGALAAQPASPVVLLRIRQTLRRGLEAEPDEVVRAERERLLQTLPDAFELRVARVLVSSQDEEFPARPGPDFATNFARTSCQWLAFCRQVAEEAAAKHPSAPELVRFVAGLLRDLDAAGMSAHPGVLLGTVATLSPEWATSLLRELAESADPRFDVVLGPVCSAAAGLAPEAYRRQLKSIVPNGRPEQLASLMNFLGAQHLTRGLDESERAAILEMTARTEDEVIFALASAAGLCFRKEPAWALEVLQRLKPASEAARSDVLGALHDLVEERADALPHAPMVQCLRNLGPYLWAAAGRDDRELQKVAAAFPRLVYECLRDQLDEADRPGAAGKICICSSTHVPLGNLRDEPYLARELDLQWRKATANPDAASGRLLLVRSLLFSDLGSWPKRFRGLLDRAEEGRELELVTELVATPGSRFMFQQPELVRHVLKRAEDTGVRREVTGLLLSSAVGAGRSHPAGQTDPESRFLSERSEALANRYKDDPILGPFYRVNKTRCFVFLDT